MIWLLETTARIATVDRARAYAPLVAGMTLVAWVLSQALGPGLLDVSGTPIGADWIAFHSGGHFALHGRLDEQYDLTAQMTVQAQALGFEDPGSLNGVCVWLSPPWTAWLLAPLAALPYTASLAVWSLLQALAYVLVVHRLVRAGLLAGTTRRWLLLGLAFFPTLAAFLYGQMSMLYLLLMTMGWLALRNGRDGLAGAWLGLLIVKPPLGLPWLLALLVQGRLRAVAGMGGVAVALIAAAEVLHPGSLTHYLAQRDMVLSVLRSPSYPTWGLVNLFGAWQALAEAWSPTLVDVATTATSLAGYAAVATMAWSLKQEPDATAHDAGWASLLVVGLLAGPHLYFYDLALLLLPLALVLAAEPPGRDALMTNPRVLGATVWLYLGAFVGPYAVKATQAATEAAGAGRIALPIPTLLFVLWAWVVWTERHRLGDASALSAGSGGSPS